MFNAQFYYLVNEINRDFNENVMTHLSFELRSFVYNTRLTFLQNPFLAQDWYLLLTICSLSLFGISLSISLGGHFYIGSFRTLAQATLQIGVP